MVCAIVSVSYGGRNRTITLRPAWSRCIARLSLKAQPQRSRHPKLANGGIGADVELTTGGLELSIVFAMYYLNWLVGTHFLLFLKCLSSSITALEKKDDTDTYGNSKKIFILISLGNSYHSLRREQRAGKMAQRAKVLAPKPDYLGLIPGTCVDGRSWPPARMSWHLHTHKPLPHSK